MNSDEQFSLVLSEALDILGYHRDIVEVRRQQYDRMSAVLTEFTKDPLHSELEGYYTVTGSRREGLEDSVNSDSDLMFTCTEVLCCDTPESENDDVKYIFELDREGCPHGYTKLRLFKRTGLKEDSFLSPMIENSLIEDANGCHLLSSTLFKSEALAYNSMVHPTDKKDTIITGPSLPTAFETSWFPIRVESDRVLAFRCKCSDYLQSWTKRPRDYDWPSQEQIDTAATLDAHVVPVGPKGSGIEHLQWRICYTLTEVKLIQSLNETKCKMYTTLKIIKDEVFKQLDGQLLTSYMLKNVVMWISESGPVEEFQPKYLLHKLRQCFDFLALCFARKRMPNYMISERNMLDGRLTHANKDVYFKALKNAQNDTIATIRRCLKLKHAMDQVICSPACINEMVRSKFEFEMMALCCISNLKPDQIEMLHNAMNGSEKQQLDGVLQLAAQNAEVISDIAGIPEVSVVDVLGCMQAMPMDMINGIFDDAIRNPFSK